MRVLCLLFVSLLLGACARSAPARPESVAPDEDELAAALHELQLRKADFARHRGMADCPEVCRLSELVCVASERVCVIAARHAGETLYEAHCTRARKDCAEAKAECVDCR